MSRSRDRPDPAKKNPNPNRAGSQTSSPADDFATNALWVLFEALWGIVVAVGVPLLSLVRFLCWDAWTKKPKG